MVGAPDPLAVVAAADRAPPPPPRPYGAPASPSDADAHGDAKAGADGAPCRLGENGAGLGPSSPRAAYEWPLHASAHARPRMFRERFELVAQRLARNAMFAPQVRIAL